MAQVDWKAEGHEGTKLVYLAMKLGFFYDGHRAETDCLAGIEALANPLASSGLPAMASLLKTARLISWRIRVAAAPFEKKDELKNRGYRWDGRLKQWYVDVPDDDICERELEWLNQNICAVHQRMKITAKDRFSDRI